MAGKTKAAAKPKRAQLSGAQKRRKHDLAIRADEDRRAAVGKSWLSQDAYKGTGAQWSEKAPPTELPVYGAPGTVMVKALESVIGALEQGQFFMPAMLTDAMTRDDRVAAKAEERIDRIVGSELDLIPCDAEDGKERVRKSPGQRVADDCKGQIGKLVPSYELSELMRYGLMLSIGIAQVLEFNDVSRRTCTFRVWNPRQLRFDWLLRRFCLITQNQGEVVIDFANGVDYSEGGISVTGDGARPTRWLVYQPFGPLGWLHGAKLRSVAIPWVIRHWARTWWAREREVHGQPIRLGIIPADRTPADERVFLTQLSNLAHEAVIRLPQGTDGNKFDVKLLEAMGNSWEGFQKLLDHCDDSIAIAFVGQSQSTKGQGGLGAQENAGESTMMRISRKDALVGGVLREQYIGPCWAEPNYGSAELAPFLAFQIEAPEDEKKASDVDLSVGKALVAFKTAGAPIDTRAYLTARGYPLLTEEQVAVDRAEATAQAQLIAKATTPEPDDDETEDKDDEEGDTLP